MSGFIYILYLVGNKIQYPTYWISKVIFGIRLKFVKISVHISNSVSNLSGYPVSGKITKYRIQSDRKYNIRSITKPGYPVNLISGPI